MEYELYHHGIKGMKWGVRRTKKQLGHDTGDSYTISRRAQRQLEKGERKERLNKAFSPTVKNGKDKPNISPAEKITKDSGKLVDNTSSAVDSVYKMHKMRKGSTNPASKMSDQELRDAVNRMNLERSYNSLMESKNVSRGKEYTMETLNVVGSVVGIAGAAFGIATAIKELRG